MPISLAPNRTLGLLAGTWGWALWALLLLLAGPAQVFPAAGEGQLEITVVDRETGQPIPCRMHLKNAAGKPRKVDKVPFWNDHFVLPGKITLKLPVGEYAFEMERGPEYLTRQGRFTINPFADDAKQVDLGRFIDMSAHGWWSGDLHVRRNVGDLELLMAAEDLHVAEAVAWWHNKKNASSGQLLPAVTAKKPVVKAKSNVGRSSSGKPDRQAKAPDQAGSRSLTASTPLTDARSPLVRFDGHRCGDTMAGGLSWSGTELLIFQLPAPLKLSAGSEAPSLLNCLAAARERPDAWVDISRPFSWDLPMLVAAGQVDSIELAHSHLCRDTLIANEADGKPRDQQSYPGPRGNALWSQSIYFQLLECGLRIPPSAGSGSGVTPNPVGYNRVYVHIDGEFSYEKWWKNLRAGQVFVTNGPLLQPSVHGKLPGHVFQADQGKPLELEIALTLSTRDPITYLEIIKNGQVEHSVRMDEFAQSRRLPKVRFEQSGWFLLRAVTDVSHTYRFAMTGPYYVEIGDRRRISKGAAQLFLDWTYERARQIKLSDSPQQRKSLEEQRQARDFWQDLLSRAKVD